MYKISFDQKGHIYFIGIGGISMSGLAEILLDAGFAVSGSDARESNLTKRLAAKGAKVFYGQRAENITDDIDAICYTAAIHPDNPEYMAGEMHHIPMISRAVLLGQLMENYQTSIAISGTHGKTSTTSMLSHILLEADTDPTISVGGQLAAISGNIRIGGREVFLTEACEYTNSFLEFCPKIEVILNVEADHMDFFKDLADIRNSFRLFVKRLPQDGCLIIHEEIRDKEEIIDGFGGEVFTFGFDRADIKAANMVYDALGFAEFDLVISESVWQRFGQVLHGDAAVVHGDLESLSSKEGARVLARIKLNAPGKHNVSNALAAIAVGIKMGISMEQIRRGIESYMGVGRRFELKGKLFDRITIVDDYAHHPQEIEATLLAAKNTHAKRIWCVFQPHTYTRTKAFMEDFAKALSLADRVVLADIYAAREYDTLGVHSSQIADLINHSQPDKAIYLESFDEIVDYLLEHLCEDDLCITMGAGDVDKIGDRLLGQES